jgi:hypothetical protein
MRDNCHTQLSIGRIALWATKLFLGKKINRI